MAGTIFEDYGTGGMPSSAEGMSSEQHYQSGDSLAEWRSCEQVENGTPSTSPLSCDTEDEDDCGPKPSELYGRFTWKIENFSTINKRELRSNAFEVGGYKWYILIYPQGCDVCNHLSLFLCVANHDKLLPGWSHFAQFTIAVVNKDPKKSKYSDTLHRFWKKEHDWGWKKFMELSKVYDDFIVTDTLVIKAQVQVIREKAHRPFRCLDCQYRRELVRVYLSNVEQICRRFVEERRGKLSKLIDDKVRWSSFRAFWLGIDPNARRCMSRDKTDAILKVVVKHFFVEKEVTSTLVMDSLYSGLKALECQSKNKKGRAQLIDLELPAPMVRIDKDMSVLADDVLLVLERAVSEPFPHQPLPPKDDKCTQNHMKDGSSGEEFNKDSIERDEWRLSELGRRTVEIFVLAHIFGRIEVAYQEAVALKRQEELIREEEAAGQAENELRAKRGAAEKDKRAKKKQGKQKRNNRKGKDRGRDEKSDAMMWEKVQQQSPSDERGLDVFPSNQMDSVIEKIDTLDDASDVSDNGDFAADVLQPDLNDRDNSTVNWDTDTSEIQLPRVASGSELPNGQTGKRNPSVMNDSSSTCSTDSVPSVVMNGPYRGTTLLNKSQASPSRAKNQRSKEIHERTVFTHGGNNPPSNTAVDADHSCDVSSSRPPQPESEAVVVTLKDQIHWLEQNLVEKEEEVVSLQKKLNIDQVDAERPSKTRTAGSSSSSSSLGKKPLYNLQQPKQSSETTAMASANTASTMTMAEPVCSKEPPSSRTPQNDKPVPSASRSPKISSTSKSEASRHAIQAKSTNSTNQVTTMSRPSSAPLTPAPRPAAPIVSTIQTVPLLSHSVSAAGRLGADQSPSAPSYIPQSYRNAIMGKTTMGASPAGFAHHSTSSGQGVGYSQAPSALVSSASVLPPQNSARKKQSSARPGFIFGPVKPETHHSQPPWKDDCSCPEPSSRGDRSSSNVVSDIWWQDIYGEIPANSYQAQGVVADEFPHLDIINDLLDEEQGNGKAAKGLRHHSFSRQYSFPGNVSAADFGLDGSCRFDQMEQFGDEGFQRIYGSSNGSVHGLREGHFSQVDLSAYANGQIDGVIQNQWLYGGTDLSMLNLGTGDANGYSYQLPEYSNLASGVNRYMYRPANGGHI